MAADLRGLMRVAKSSVDDKQRELATLLRRAEDLTAQRAALDRDLERERPAATPSETTASPRSPASDQLGAAFFSLFAASVVTRRQSVDQALAAVEQEIEAARSNLADAFRELRALELTEEARERRRAAAAARREQGALDEMGLQRYQRGGSVGVSMSH